MLSSSRRNLPYGASDLVSVSEEKTRTKHKYIHTHTDSRHTNVHVHGSLLFCFPQQKKNDLFGGRVQSDFPSAILLCAITAASSFGILLRLALNHPQKLSKFIAKFDHKLLAKRHPQVE